jgi:hypothetical protein
MVPGFVEQEQAADLVSIVFAIPCSPTGEVDPTTRDEYEDLADERFHQLCPGQQLA